MKKMKDLRECWDGLTEDGHVIHISEDERTAILTALECDKAEREEAYEVYEWMSSPCDKARINLLEKMIKELESM